MLMSDAKHRVSKHEGIDTRVFQQPVRSECDAALMRGIRPSRRVTKDEK
jgi:hypothetical protein